MPYLIIKKGNYYQVRNKDTGRINAKKTTKTKAEGMIRLLNYVDPKKHEKK